MDFTRLWWGARVIAIIRKRLKWREEAHADKVAWLSQAFFQ
jgi:hypothetical protein